MMSIVALILYGLAHLSHDNCLSPYAYRNLLLKPFNAF